MGTTCHAEGLFGKITRKFFGSTSGGETKEGSSGGHGIDGGDKTIPSAKLSNGVSIPLVGLGAGNMPPESISAVLGRSLKNDRNVRLIDTAQISGNEFLIAKGIVEGVKESTSASSNSKEESEGASAKKEVHVV